LEKITPGGSTALYAGLENGIKAARKLTREANLVLLLSDGLANIGETDLEVIGQSAKKAAQKDIIVSTIGVGLDYNEAMMAEIASQGSGRFYHIESPDQIPNFIAGELGESANWAAKDLEIRLALPKGASAMAVSSIYPVTQSGQTVILSAGDIPCDTWIEIPVRISFPVQAVGNKLTISGKFSHGTPVGKGLGGAANSVMLRIKDKASFLPTSGVVEDVLVKVFEKRKAASLINIKRAMFSRRIEYASRLGKERSEREMREVERYVSDLYGPSHLSKSRIYDSYAKTRGQKDFRK
jgi:Ca-activated chloride channel family protein